MEFILYLVRHGETEHNKDCIIQGQLDVPLSNAGIEQAKLLTHTLGNKKWKEVYASDLKRSWQTANIILSSKANIEDNCTSDVYLDQLSPLIRMDERLRERHFGAAQGQPTSFLVQSAKKTGIAVSKYLPPEAETQIDVRVRAISFFKDLCSKVVYCKTEEKPSVLIVGHGGWLREFFIYLTSLREFSPSETYRKEAFKRLSPNTGVSSFEIKLDETGDVRVIKCLSLNDASHLKTNIGTDELAL